MKDAGGPPLMSPPVDALIRISDVTKRYDHDSRPALDESAWRSRRVRPWP